MNKHTVESYIRSYGAAALLALLPILSAVFFRGWLVSILLSCLLILVVAVIQARHPGWETKFAICLALFGSVDFLKRLVFLAPGQALWSQYLVFLFPYVYYFFFLLLPWLLEGKLRTLDGFQKFVFVLIGWFLFNTWFVQGTSTVAKLAASGVWIMPWTIMAVAVDHPGALSKAGKTLAVVAVISVAYGLWHFFIGPTPVEVNWAQASGDISIGANQIVSALTQRHGRIYIWRPIGLQADPFTFALLLLNVFVLASILRSQGIFSRRQHVALGLILLLGIGLSLVRTVWIATAVFFVYALLARRFRSLIRPWTVIVVMLAAFILANQAAGILYQFRGFAHSIANNTLARVLTLETLSARMNAGTNFWLALPGLLFRGFGYAASPWITTKFGGFHGLPKNFAEHNLIVEWLWLFGLPGVVLLFTLIHRILARAERAFAAVAAINGIPAILAALLLSMYVYGLANGGTFLAPLFFFIIGATAGLRLPAGEAGPEPQST